MLMDQLRLFVARQRKTFIDYQLQSLFFLLVMSLQRFLPKLVKIIEAKK